MCQSVYHTILLFFYRIFNVSCSVTKGKEKRFGGKGGGGVVVEENIHSWKKGSGSFFYFLFLPCPRFAEIQGIGE